MQREALPQLSTSKPSLFQMRMRTSATSDGSSTITWSQPMPVLRSAMARAFASSMEMARERASSTTKSLPSPFILRKGSAPVWVISGGYMVKRAEKASRDSGPTP